MCQHIFVASTGGERSMMAHRQLQQVTMLALCRNHYRCSAHMVQCSTDSLSPRTQCWCCCWSQPADVSTGQQTAPPSCCPYCCTVAPCTTHLQAQPRLEQLLTPAAGPCRRLLLPQPRCPPLSAAGTARYNQLLARRCHIGV